MTQDLQQHLIERLMAVRNMPAVLYHYTSADALDGILQSRRLWATHVAYLNDSSEYRYTMRLASGHLGAFGRRSTDPRLAALHAEWERALELAADNHVYVISLSASRDLLSQWRSYAPKGFALGFDQTHLL